ncbi:hypothetical protein C9439_03780 [archaeon SCG-AAA382B04]|nr:hypothetical protein C9439_03780 [archaeon SCG-AAA382B04]
MIKSKNSIFKKIRLHLQYKLSLLWPPRRAINTVLTRIQRKLKPTKVLGYPREITIDPINKCNINCKLCPTGKNKEGRTKSTMSFSLYKKLISEIGPYVSHIDFHNWGEPLLNPKIFDMIELARDYGIFVKLSTNLNHFNEGICKKLIENPPDVLMISLFGASQKTVEKYHEGSNFTTVIKNMKKVIKKRNNAGKVYPFVQWRFLVNKYNEDEIKKAEEIADKIGIDRFEISPLRCNMEKELFMDENEQFKDAKEWLPKKEEFSRYNYKKEGKKEKHKLEDDCGWLWEKCTINPNGSVSPCCSAWFEKFDFGNVKDKPLKEIWNNEKYQQARQIVSGDDIKDSELICQICYDNNAQV